MTTTMKFTCIGKGHGAPAIPATREEWEKMRGEQWLAEMCRRIVAGDEALKGKLPVWTPCCAEFKDNHRAKADALRPLPRLMLDFDEKGHSEEILTRSLQLQAEGKWEILLVEESVRRGTHVLIALPEGMTPEEAQRRFSTDVGFVADPALKDVSRCIYMVTNEHTLYVSEKLFSCEPRAVSNELVESEEVNVVNAVNSPVYNTEFRGIPYAEIVDELVRRTGGEPYEGERNNRLYLICRLLANITDRQVERLFQVCPRFGLSEGEVRACCESACKSARTEKMPYLLYKVLREKGVDIYHSDQGQEVEGEAESPAYQMPPLPEHLPPLIREFVDTAPDDFKAATALACLPVCGFLGSRLRARYIDGELQAPSFIVNVIAPAASGKGSLLRIPDICLERVRKMDDMGREEEAEYQRQIKLKKNEKKQLDEPQPIVRDIPAKVSVAQLLKRMVQAQGLHLISISPEADTLTNSNKSGAWAQKSDIYRIAMDNDGGRYGQDYKSDVSFSATCKMRYNLLTLGTPGAFARAYPDVEDGLVTRCIMVELPNQFGKPMPVRQELTPRQMQVIRRKVDALMAVCQDEAGSVLPEHHLSLNWLCEGMSQWIDEQRMQAIRDEDYARDQLMRRAALYGFRAGMIACFLYGRVTPERKAMTIDFSRWVAQCMLYGLLTRYREKMNEEAARYERPHTARFPSVWEAMPDIFTMRDLQRVLVAQGMKTPSKNIVYRWTLNGLIEKQGENYVKVIENEKLKIKTDDRELKVEN